MRYWSVSVVFLVCASACAQVDAPVHDYPEDNAWHNYYRAFDLVPDDDEIANRIDNADGEPSVDDVRRYVAGSKLALDELRRGLGKPCAIVYAEPDDFLAFIHEMSGIPRNAKVREMARRLRWEAWLHRKHGDGPAALRSHLDATAFSQDVARNGGVMPMLVSIACEVITFADMGETLQLVGDDAPALVEFIDGFERLRARRVTYGEMLAFEQWEDVETIKRIKEFDDHAGPESIREAYGHGPLGAAMILARRDLREFYAAAIPMADGPSWTWDMSELPQPEDGSLAGEMVPVGGMTDYVMRTAIAHVDAALIMAAAQLHKARTGAYPKSLDALSPGILAELPPDPFTGQAFRYGRLEGDAYTLYSVGPNRVDDGGTSEDRQDLVFSPQK